MSFDATCSDENISYGVVADAITGVIEQSFGNNRLLPHQGIVNNLAGDPAALQRLAQSLRGQILPQMYGQGSVAAYASLIGGRVIVLFESNDASAEEQYRKAQRIETALRIAL